jgi:hypothetical protein
MKRLWPYIVEVPVSICGRVVWRSIKVDVHDPSNAIPRARASTGWPTNHD